MSRGLIKRNDGSTVDLDLQEANQDSLTALAKRIILVDDSGNVINSSNPLPVDTEITLSGNVIVQDVDINNISAGTQTNDVKVTLDGEGITATNLDIRDLTSVSDSVEVKQSTASNLNANVSATHLDIRHLNTTDDAVNVGTVTTLPSITGTVTANAGTNLNTSTLALETGGNLASINTKLVSGTDIGDVTINNSNGASAVNIQDGGNTITVDGTVNSTNLLDTYIQRIAYDSNGFVIYVGLAVPGSADSSLVWQIKKFTNNSTGQTTAVNFADSNTNFDNSWELRESGYIYG